MPLTAFPISAGRGLDAVRGMEKGQGREGGRCDGRERGGVEASKLQQQSNVVPRRHLPLPHWHSGQAHLPCLVNHPALHLAVGLKLQKAEALDQMKYREGVLWRLLRSSIQVYHSNSLGVYEVLGVRLRRLQGSCHWPRVPTRLLPPR